MNEATLELARRAVASPHWRWMPGMRIVYAESNEAFRVCAEPAWVDGLCHRHGIDEDWDAAPDGELPDLDDPLTAEAVCILAREAWGADSINVRLDVWAARKREACHPHQPLLGAGTVQFDGVDMRTACYVGALLKAPTPEEK